MHAQTFTAMAARWATPGFNPGVPQPGVGSRNEPEARRLEKNIPMPLGHLPKLVKGKDPNQIAEAELANTMRLLNFHT